MSKTFFCHTHFLDLPLSEQSPDPRYCRTCCEFLLNEAKLLPKGKHPHWIPKTKPEVDKIPANLYRVSLPMSTPLTRRTQSPVAPRWHRDPIVPHGKRGRKKLELPEDTVKELHQGGLGSKAIASTLRHKGISVSYKTIQRLLLSFAGD